MLDQEGFVVIINVSGPLGHFKENIQLLNCLDKEVTYPSIRFCRFYESRDDFGTLSTRAFYSCFDNLAVWLGC